MPRTENVSVHIEFNQGAQALPLKKIFSTKKAPRIGTHLSVSTPLQGLVVKSYIYEKSVDEKKLKGTSVIVPSELDFQQFRRFLLENGWKPVED